MNFIKNKKDYILSFFVPFIIFLTIFLLIKYGGGANNVTVVSDLEAQYVALLAKFRDIITFNQNPFYSFSNSLGGSLVGTFIYYLISPVNFLVLLFPRTNMMDASLLIIAVKVGLSSLMMKVLIERLNFKLISSFKLILTSSYALMGYVMGYYFHIMWLDAIYMLPLVIVGIEEVINNKKSLIYLVSLSLTFIFNFYIGYMVAIFSAIYFCYKLYLDNDNVRNKITKFINFSILSILSGIMSFFVIFPMLKELSLTQKAAVNVFSLVRLIIDIDIFEMFSRFYIGYHDATNILNLESYHLYIGIFALSLIFLYFLNKSIKLKEKLASFVIILIFLFSFAVNYLSFVWHGFNSPLAFNYRFSFLLSFFLVLLAIKGLVKISKNNKKDYFIAGSIFIILSALIMIFSYDSIKYYYLYINIILFISYLGLLFLYNDKEYIYKRKLLVIMIMFLAISELFFNFSHSLSSYVFSTTKEKNENREFVEKLLKEMDDKNNSNFYRFDKNFHQTYIDSLYFEYNGLSSFISTIKQTQLNFYKATGYSSITNSIMYKHPNYLIDSLNGFKYIALRNKDAALYNLMSEHKYSIFDGFMYGVLNGKVKLYENPYAMSLGYEVSDKTLSFVEELKKHPTLTYFQFNNIVASSMNGEDIEIFSPVEVIRNDGNNYEFETAGKKYFYVYVENDILEDNLALDVIVNDEVIGTYNMREKFIMLFENINLNDTAKIELKPYGDFVYYQPLVASFDEDIFSNFITNLKSNEMELIEFKDGYVKGSINSENGDILYTSIPFEPGWSAKINGVRVPIKDLFGSFIGLELNPGENIIELRYTPPYLGISLLISLIGLGLSYLYFKKEKKLVKTISALVLKYIEIINYLIVGFLTTAVSVIVYYIFTRYFGIYYLISEAISWIFAVTFAFFMNKKYVFHSKEKNIIKELINFFNYRLLSLFIDISLMYSLVSIIKIDDLVSKILVQITVIVLNYYFSKKFVFKK
jgi:uncharacterized membrane protein YfhO/putative flippase GtrA